MNRISNYIVGPELLWILFYTLTVVLVKATHSPLKSMDPFWENTGYIVPLVLVPLTFALYFIPGVRHDWLLLRIWIAVLIGSNYVLSKGLSVHSEGGPGVGTIYMVGMAFTIVMLVAGSIFVWIKFR